MPDYTQALGLEKPLQSEGYNVDVFNRNADAVDAAVAQMAADVSGKVDVLGLDAEGQMPVITGGQLAGSGLQASDVARKATVLALTLAAANWANSKYTITNAVFPAQEPPGGIGPQTGATKAQLDNWRDANIAIETWAAGRVVLRVDGSIPNVDIPVKMEMWL